MVAETMSRGLSDTVAAAHAACPGHSDLREASRAELVRVKAMPFAQPAALVLTLREARSAVKLSLAETRSVCARFLSKPATRRALLKPVRFKSMFIHKQVRSQTRSALDAFEAVSAVRKFKCQ